MGRKLKSLIFRLPYPILKNIYHIYDYFAYPELRETRCTFGVKNPKVVFYIIRPITNSNEGLMSLLLNVCRHILYSESKGYVPIVDFKNYSTQYSDDNFKNVWEYYFEQISPYTLDEVYSSKNVILSGLRPIRENTFEPDIRFNDIQLKLARDIIKKYIVLKPDVERLLKKELLNLPENLVGLYLRGTDYTGTKPIGHYIQPTLLDVNRLVFDCMSKYANSKVFLVTEDEKNFIDAKKKFEDKLVIVSFDTFIHNYDNNKLLFESDSLNQISFDKYDRGLKYLIKILILSKCKIIIGGNTCGSWAAAAFSDKNTEIHILDLGKYK